MRRKKYLKIKEDIKNIILTDGEEIKNSQMKLYEFIKLLKRTEKEIIDRGYDKESLVVFFDHEYCMEGEYFGSDLIISGERNETDKERDTRLAKSRKQREEKKAIKEKIEAQERKKYEELKMKFEGSK